MDTAYRPDKTSAPIPTMPPDPFQFRGRPRTARRKKEYEEWTEEEKRAYREYISAVRSACGRMAGYVGQGGRWVPKTGPRKTTTLWCNLDDYNVFKAVAHSRSIALAALIREYAASLRADPRYAHLFAAQPDGPAQATAEPQTK